MPKPQYVRTFVAAMVGVFIARIIAAVPVVAASFAWVDGFLAEAGYAGISALALVQAVLTAAIVLAYQRVAQWAGDRWPAVEKAMLGSDARPSYTPRYGK